MARLVLALLMALGGFALGLLSKGWDLTSAEQLRRIIEDPGSLPSRAPVFAALGFVLVFVVSALISAARRTSAVATSERPTQAIANDPPGPSTAAAIGEASPALSYALSSLTLFTLRFFTVPQGWLFTITLFGRYRRIAPPGLGHCLSLWGLYERVGLAVPQMEQLDSFDEESVFTSDGVQCLIDVMVCYRVVNAEAALYEVSDYREAIRQLVQAVLRNECGKRTTRNLLSGREEMAENLRVSLANDVEPWGITVRLVELTNIQIRQEAK